MAELKQVPEQGPGEAAQGCCWVNSYNCLRGLVIRGSCLHGLVLKYTWAFIILRVTDLLL